MGWVELPSRVAMAHRDSRALKLQLECTPAMESAITADRSTKSGPR